MIGFDQTSRISDPAARMALAMAAIARSPITLEPAAPLVLTMMHLDDCDLAVLRWIASHTARKRPVTHA